MCSGQRGDVKQILAEFGTPENLKDPRIRSLLFHLLRQWSLQQDHERDTAFLEDLHTRCNLAISGLVELHRTKNSSLGMAAHDLRNPLISIRGLAEILLSGAAGELSQGQREYLSIISSTSNGMLGLVNDLLDVSLMERGHMTLHRVMGSMKDLVEERIQVYSVIAGEKDIRLSARCDPIPDFLLDPVRLGQVMDNLLSNAVKFSPPGSLVNVFLEKEGNSARFTVVDRGAGIPPEDLERIFHEFQKSRTRPTAGEKSTGLGLAIARKIVEAHGGQISAHNGPREGAVFSFHIPFSQPV